MFKKLLGISLALSLLVSNVAYAATSTLASPYTVTSTSLVNVPGIQLNAVQCVNTSFMGGGLPMWVCSAIVTVKDGDLVSLSTGMMFGTTPGQLAQTVNNPDGSVSKLYMVVNPKGMNSSAKIVVKGQVARIPAQGLTPQAVIVLDPPTGDIFKIEG